MRKLSKTLLRSTCVALAACSVAATFTACKGKENREDTLYVAVIKKGYGTDWLTGLLDGYVAKNTEMKYEIIEVYADKQMADTVEAGAGACNYDMIFTGQVSPCNPEYLADLTEIYDYTYESGSRQGKKVRETMETSVLKSMTERLDGSSYKVIPWSGSTSGLLINLDVVEGLFGADWQNTYKMRTTDEMLAFCKAAKDKGKPSFIHAANTNTHGSFAKVWWAQYNGVEGVNDYNNGRYVNDEGNKTVGVEVVRNEGTLKAAQVMQQVFGDTHSVGGYSHKDSNGLEWSESQSRFMTGDSTMRGGGDWFMTEMGKTYPNTRLTFNRVPVISALGEKLGITDAELATLVSYVDDTNDGKTVEKPTVTSTKNLTIDELIAKVKEARAWTYSSADFFTAAAVSYSPKLDKVKDFFKYMVSDEGQKIYTEKTQGLSMAYGYNLEKDYEGFNELPEFAKTRWSIVKNTKYVFAADVTTKYGAKQFAPFSATSKAPIEVLLSQDEDKWDAQKMYDYDYTYYQPKWSTYNN